MTLKDGPITGPLTLKALQTFMNRSETPMLLSDADLRYRHANEAACRLFGLSREELLSRSVGELTPNRDKSGLAERVEAFRADGRLSGTVTIVGAGGEQVEIEFNSIADVVPGLALSLLEPVEGQEPSSSPEESAEGPEGPLSPRESEVLTALALGRTGAEIATDLVISPETVRNHVRHARTKLGARTRAQAIALALQRGEIQL